MKPLTRKEVLALPPVTDLRTLGRALGLSEPVIRERHRQGQLAELGIRVLRLGAQYRVVTEDVLRVLGISRDALAGTAEAVPADASDSPSRSDGSHANHMPVI